MDSKRNKPKLNNPIFLLEKNNYYISYDYCQKTNIASVYISWLDETYRFIYDTANQALTIEYYDTEIKCPPYAIGPVIYSMILRICKENGYSDRFLITKVNGNKTSNLCYAENNEEPQKSESLMLLIKEVVAMGLRPEDIELAKVHNVFEGFDSFAKVYFGIEKL